jgi:DNA-binding response OmpR family regulator
LAAQSEFVLNAKSSPHSFAEDDRDTRELVQLVLCQAGFRVSVTGDSSEVLQLLATNNFDALLLDNWMPEVTGLELCRTIRTFDQNTPIFFCSGAVTEADKTAALSAGAQGYIGKPFDPDDLIRSLRGALTQTPLGKACEGN